MLQERYAHRQIAASFDVGRERLRRPGNAKVAGVMDVYWLQVLIPIGTLTLAIQISFGAGRS